MEDFHFERAYTPARAEKDPEKKREYRMSFIETTSFIVLAIFVLGLMLSIGDHSFIFSFGFLLLIMILFFGTLFLVGILYPYWNYYIGIDNNYIRIRSRGRKLFPYYVQIIKFDLKSELKILYNPDNKAAIFKQNNHKEVTTFKGLEDNELKRIFDFLKKKNNVHITVLENPIDEKTRAKQYFLIKYF